MAWFTDPDSVIRMAFAHEAAHAMNLYHRPMNWHIIMVENVFAGAFDGQGIWRVFRSGGNDALTGQFRLKP